MSLNADSKYREEYHLHVFGEEKLYNTLGKVFDLISDISDRRGIKHEWNQIDGDIQDTIIEKWVDILSSKETEEAPQEEEMSPDKKAHYMRIALNISGYNVTEDFVDLVLSTYDYFLENGGDTDLLGLCKVQADAIERRNQRIDREIEKKEAKLKELQDRIKELKEEKK